MCNRYLYLILLSIGLLQTFVSLGQVNDTSRRQIEILQADRLNFQNIDSVTQLQSLAGNVLIRQDQTLFYCDSAVLNKALNMMEAFGHVHINDADSIHTYADYVRYMGNNKKAYLKNNVKLTDGKGILTTSELLYDLQTKIGTYTKGGKVISGKTVLTSIEGFYYGETKDVYFKRKVVLKDPDYDVTTDTLLYNTGTQVATFVAPTNIISGDKRKIVTREGYYDIKNRKAYFGKRPTIVDGCTMLIADEVANDDQSGFGEASGNVIYKDSCEGIVILANNLKTNRKTSSFLATQKPIAILGEGKDSVFIAADTLYSAKLSELKQTRFIPEIRDSSTIASISTLSKTDSSSDRFIEAYYHVKIYTDSLQTICDSLFYSNQDSIFRLFKNPVVWAQESQLTGDTIYLYTQHKKPSRLFVFENALAINKVAAQYYNQVKGRTINGYFKNGEIDQFRAKGNAENIYYGMDEDSSFLGVNKSQADVIDMYFEKKQPQKVVFRTDVKGTSYPMGQANHQELRLRGFMILEDQRPKTKYDLF